MDVEKFSYLASMVQDARTAQNVVMQMFLPYYDYFFTVAEDFYWIVALLGTGWLILRTFAGPGETNPVSHLIFIGVALVVFYPSTVKNMSWATGHDDPAISKQLEQMPNADMEFRMPFGLKVFTGVTHWLEDKLYYAKEHVDKSGQNNFSMIKGLSMPLLDYANEPDYGILMQQYIGTCNNVTTAEENRQIPFAHWAQLGLAGGGGLGFRGSMDYPEDPSFFSKTIAFVFGRDTIKSRDDDLAPAIAALDSEYLAASRSDVAGGIGHKILTDSYWAAKLSGESLTDVATPYEEVVREQYQRFVNESADGTVPLPPPTGEDRFKWYARTCGDLYRFADLATKNLREGMAVALNADIPSSVDPEAGSGGTFVREPTGTSDINTVMLSRLAAQQDYEKNGGEGYGAYEMVSGAARKGLLNLQESFFESWSADIIVMSTIGIAVFGIALLYMFSPLLIIASMIPGKRDLLIFMFEAIAVLKLALFLMFFVLDSGVSMLVSMQEIVATNIRYGGVIGGGPLIPILEYGPILISMALGAVVLLAYMIVFTSGRNMAGASGTSVVSSVMRTAFTAAAAAGLALKGGALAAGSAARTGATAIKTAPNADTSGEITNARIGGSYANMRAAGMSPAGKVNGDSSPVRSARPAGNTIPKPTTKPPVTSKRVSDAGYTKAAKVDKPPKTRK